MFICMTIAGSGTKTCVCAGARGAASIADGLVSEMVLPGELGLCWLEMKECLCSELEGYAHKW